MNNKKEAIACVIIAAILIFAGTSTKSYIFEILAIAIIVFGYIITQLDDLFSKPKTQGEKTKCEEK